MKPLNDIRNIEEVFATHEFSLEGYDVIRAWGSPYSSGIYQVCKAKGDMERVPELLEDVIEEYSTNESNLDPITAFMPGDTQRIIDFSRVLDDAQRIIDFSRGSLHYVVGFYKG